MAKHNEDELQDAEKPKKRRAKRNRKKQSAKARAATLANLKKAKAAVKARQKASGKKARRPSTGRTHRKKARRRRRGSIRRTGTAAFRPKSNPVIKGGALVSLELPVAGNTPVPTFNRGPGARAGDAGARRPSLNGQTIDGKLLVPRATDGLKVDIRQLAVALKLR